MSPAARSRLCRNVRVWPALADGLPVRGLLHKDKAPAVSLLSSRWAPSERSIRGVGWEEMHGQQEPAIWEHCTPTSGWDRWLGGWDTGRPGRGPRFQGKSTLFGSKVIQPRNGAATCVFQKKFSFFG